MLERSCCRPRLRDRTTGCRSVRIQAATKFSTLAQINTVNVKDLKRAWTFHTGDKSGFFESTPLVIDSVMYFSAATVYMRSMP